MPHLKYSSPSAIVNASSSTASAPQKSYKESVDSPASCMWYPEMEMELYFCMCFAVYPIISPTMRIEGAYQISGCRMVTRGINVRISHHKLLQNVVLNSALQLTHL